MCLLAQPPTHTHIFSVHSANACSKSGSFAAKPQLFFTHTLWFVHLSTNCTCASQGCPQSYKCMRAQLNLTAWIRKSKTNIARRIRYMKKNSLSLVMLMRKQYFPALWLFFFKNCPVFMLSIGDTVYVCVSHMYMYVHHCLCWSGEYFCFVITEHQPPFLFWSWCYLAGTVMCAPHLILLSTQHGLQIYIICVFLYIMNSFWIGMYGSSWVSGFEA